MENQEVIKVINEIGPMMRKPAEELEAAKEAAMALTNVIKSKKRPVLFNGEQYLEFEDWQTVGRFYGLAVRVTETKMVEIDETKGWEAHAEVFRASDGAIISSADSMCMNDEKNWASKPQFQIRSMAQTRACAKAYRNVLAWVVVLAGYKPTPAEEMEGVTPKRNSGPRRLKADDIPDDQLPNWVIPFGTKYKGLSLSKVFSQESGSGKAVGRDYLEWCVENGRDPEIKEIISRFLAIITQEPTIQV
jgi:hypothetical protein